MNDCESCEYLFINGANNCMNKLDTKSMSAANGTAAL